MTWGLLGWSYFQRLGSRSSDLRSRRNVAATRTPTRSCCAFYCAATHRQLFPVFEWQEREKRKSFLPPTLCLLYYFGNSCQKFLQLSELLFWLERTLRIGKNIFFPNISDSTWMHSESLRFSFVRTVKCSPSLRVWNCKVMWVADRQAARLDSTAFTSIY